MSVKVIPVVAVSAAVIAGAVAYVKNGMSREAEARHLAEAAASEEAKAEAVRKTEKSAAEKAAAEKAAAEAKARAAADEKETALQDRQTAELRQKEAADNRKAKEAAAKAAEAERETARLKAKAAADAAKTAADEKEKAKALESAETAKAAAAADKLAAEKLRSEKVIAEAKALELQKIDFETWQRDLIEFKQELDERERALTPDKTVADLAWVGGMDDKVVDEHGNLVVAKKEPYLAENDRTLPKATRRLAKLQREVYEAQSNSVEMVKARMIGSLELLYIQALKDDRVVDAQFYKQNLETLKPGWALKADSRKNEEKNEQ